MKDWLARGEESAVRVTFTECSALLVDGELHYWSQVGEDVHAVLEANGHVEG